MWNCERRHVDGLITSGSFQQFDLLRLWHWSDASSVLFIYYMLATGDNIPLDMRTNGILKSASNLRSLIKVLAVYLNKSSIFDYPKHVCQVKTDQPIAQDKLRFCWTYLSGGTFSHVATHIIVSIKPSEGNDVCEQRKYRLSVEATTACRYLRLILNIWAELQLCKTSLWGVPLCTYQRFRSVCAQSDQNLHWAYCG